MFHYARVLYLITIILSIACSSKGQSKLKLEQTKEFCILGNKIIADKLENFYIINGDKLHKYNSKGESLCSYSNKSLGRIENCDVSNPFKILVLHKSANTVVFLDKNLSASGESIDLNKINYFDIENACSSQEGGFWLFDTDQQELVHFSNSLTEIANSGNINLLVETNLKPSKIISLGKSVYVADNKAGLLIFDSFATFNKTIPFENILNFWILDEFFVFRKVRTLHFLHKNMLEEHIIKISDEKIISTELVNNKFYILENNKLRIFNITNE